jgi:hypothetical protein
MDKVEEMFTDTRGILRSLKSEKGRQNSDKQKRGQRNKQRSTKHKIICEGWHFTLMKKSLL